MQVDEQVHEQIAAQDEDLVITSVRLTRGTRAELEALAPGYRHGRSAIIREAIDEHLRRLRGEAA